MWELKDGDTKRFGDSFLFVLGFALVFLLGLKSCQYAVNTQGFDSVTAFFWNITVAIFGFVAIVASSIYGVCFFFFFLYWLFKVGIFGFFLLVSKFFDLLKVGRFRYLVIAFFLLAIGSAFIFLNFYSGEINGAFFRNNYNHCLDWIGRQIN
jgi:hypothetical protein